MSGSLERDEEAEIQAQFCIALFCIAVGKVAMKGQDRVQGKDAAGRWLRWKRAVIRVERAGK
jgi:hypothetical protein